MDVPERYEQLIAFLDSNLSAPVDRHESADGTLQFIGGEPADVVVSLTPTSVIVSEFAGVWETPFTFAAKPRRVGVLKWRRLPETALFNALQVSVSGLTEALSFESRCAAEALARLTRQPSAISRSIPIASRKAGSWLTHRIAPSHSASACSSSSVAAMSR